MGRELRAIDRDEVYHTICRGSNRSSIAWDTHDCDAFVDELYAVRVEVQWQVFAWCLMPNHYHSF